MLNIREHIKKYQANINLQKKIYYMVGLKKFSKIQNYGIRCIINYDFTIKMYSVFFMKVQFTDTAGIKDNFSSLEIKTMTGILKMIGSNRGFRGFLIFHMMKFF